MAFDLYFNKERQFIDVHEESLFVFVNESNSYPKLDWLWENFYRSPSINPDVANELVHELLALKAELSEDGDNKYLMPLIDRLLPFFSRAYKSNIQIRCSSD